MALTSVFTVAAVPGAQAEKMKTQEAGFVDPATRGPALGAIAAFPTVLTDHERYKQTLATLAGPHGTVILFNRSLDWCPYCKRQAEDLAAKADAFRAAGYGIAVLTYDSVEKLQKFASTRDISFPLLSDPGSNTIDAFGLRNTDLKPGSFADGVPFPMIIVTGPDGTVKAKFAEAGYKARPDLDAVLAALADIDAGS